MRTGKLNGNSDSFMKVGDHFEHGDHFLEVLDLAGDNAELADNEAGVEFVDTLRVKWEDSGMRTALSYEQHKWLMNLAQGQGRG